MPDQPSNVDVRRRTATVRGVEFGRGRPEIIVPLVGDDLDARKEYITQYGNEYIRQAAEM